MIAKRKELAKQLKAHRLPEEFFVSRNSGKVTDFIEGKNTPWGKTGHMGTGHYNNVMESNQNLTSKERKHLHDKLLRDQAEVEQLGHLPTGRDLEDAARGGYLEELVTDHKLYKFDDKKRKKIINNNSIYDKERQKTLEHIENLEERERELEEARRRYSSWPSSSNGRGRGSRKGPDRLVNVRLTSGGYTSMPESEYKRRFGR